MNPLQLFQNATDFETFSAGQVIFEAGQPGDVMSVLKEGQVELWVPQNVVETVEPVVSNPFFDFCSGFADLRPHLGVA